MKKNKLQKNCSTLEEKIKEQTGWNKARVFIVVGFVISVITLGRVNLKKIATKINPEQNKEANYRRLSRFFQKFKFNKRTMAKLMAAFLPDEKWVVTMDRTNWKLGKVHINILVVAVAYKGMAIPIIWYLLSKDRKRGNSNYRDRIRVMRLFIEIFGVNKIKVLVADREFVGKAWFKWLKKRNIPFVIRFKKNTVVKVGDGTRRVDSLFNFLKVGEHTFYKQRKTIYGYENLSIVALRLEDEYLILATNIDQKLALTYYKQRWEIEMLFSAFKKRGFNLEETHLSENQKIDSLIALLSIAFAWSHSIGEWLNDKKPIKTLKHGRLAKSIFLYGLEYLSEIMLNFQHRIRDMSFVFRHLLKRLEFGEI